MSPFSKFLLVQCAIFCSFQYAHATQWFWKASSGNNTSTSANWHNGSCVGSTGTPASGDTIVYASCGGSSTNCTVDANMTVAMIDIRSSYTGTITMSSAITLTWGMGSFKGGTFTGSTGALTSKTSLTIDGTAFTSTSGTFTNIGSFSFKSGSFSHNNGTMLFKKGTSSITVITGPTGTSPVNLTTITFYKIEFKGDSSSNTFDFRDITPTVTNELKISGSNSVFINSQSSTIINVTGNITSANSASTGGGGIYLIINGTGSQSITDSQGSGISGKLPNVTINKSSGTLSLYGAIGLGGSAAWKYTAGTINEGSAKLICFYNDSIVNASGGIMKFYDLELQGNGGTQTIVNTVLVDHTFSTSQSGNCVINGGTLNLQGDLQWNNSASSSWGNASFLFTGDTIQYLSGSVSPHLYNMQINKTGGYDSLKTLFNVANSLTLTNGYLLSDTTDLLVFLNGAIVSGGSDTSFIDGPVKKIGNASFTFPIGDNYYYKPFSISAPTSATDSYTARHFQEQQTFGNTKDTSLTYVSDCEYWKLKRNVGSSSVTISIGYNGNSCRIDTTSTLKIARWTGSTWSKVASTSVSGDASKGVISTSSTFSDGYFTVGKRSATLTVHAGNDTTLCSGGHLKLGATTVASGGLPPYKYSWSPGNFVDTIYNARPMGYPDTTTYYVLTVSDRDEMTVRDTIKVRVRSVPIIDAGSEQHITIGDSIQLGGSPTVSSGTSPFTYSWSPSSSLSSSTSSNPWAKPYGTTSYALHLTDSAGCVYIVNATIDVDLPSFNSFGGFDILSYDSMKAIRKTIIDGKAGSHTFIDTTIQATDSTLINTSTVTAAISDATSFAGGIHALNRTRLNRHLGGQTLSPGVYKIDSVAILNGTLTLNGDNVSNYLFDFGDSLIVNSGAKMILNDVSPSQIYFRVAGVMKVIDSAELYGAFIDLTKIIGGNINGLVSLHATTGPIKLGTVANSFPIVIVPKVVSGALTHSGFTDFFGFNGNNVDDGNTSWSDSKLRNNVMRMAPTLLRLPAGGNAKRWNWNDGYFINPADFDVTTKAYYPIIADCFDGNPYNNNTNSVGLDKPTDFKFVLNELGASGVFIPNMFMNLGFQEGYLQYLTTLNIPVKYVEMGNEFYLSGNTCSFGQPSDYFDAVKAFRSWLNSNGYTSTQIGVVGSMNSDESVDDINDCRRFGWNVSMFNSSNNLQGSLNTNDAITFHIYPQSGLINYASGVTGEPVRSELDYMMCKPFLVINNFQNNELRTIPNSNIKAWITEYNLRDQNFIIHGSWAHGLFTAALTMGFLECSSIDRLTCQDLISNFVAGSLFNTAVAFENTNATNGKYLTLDHTGIMATAPYGLTAQGITLKIISEAFRNCTTAYKITFAGGPLIKSGPNTTDLKYNALYGWKFVKSSDEQYVILNLSSSPVTISTSSLCNTPTNTYMYDEISGDPLSYIDGNLNTTGQYEAYSVISWTTPTVTKVNLPISSGQFSASTNIILQPYAILHIFKKGSMAITKSSNGACLPISQNPNLPTSNVNFYAQGAYSYTWSISGTGGVLTAPTILNSKNNGNMIALAQFPGPTSTYTISVTGKDELGSTIATDTVQIHPRSVPTPTAPLVTAESGTGTGCVITRKLLYSVEPNTGYFTWEPSIGLDFLLNETYANATFNWSHEGQGQSYTRISVDNTDGCISEDITPVLYANPSGVKITCSGCTFPTIPTIPPSGSITLGQSSVKLNASNATTYSWNWIDQSGSHSASGSQLTITPSVTTTYTLTGATGTACSKDYFTVEVGPIAQINQKDYYVCKNGSAINNTVSVGAKASENGVTDFDWQPSSDFANVTTSSGGGISTGSADFGPPANGSPGDITITITPTLTEGTVTDQSTVHVVDYIKGTGISPSSSPSSPINVTAGNSVTLTASDTYHPSGGADFIWSDDTQTPGSAFSSISGSSVTVTPRYDADDDVSNGTTYSKYYVTESASCCCKKDIAYIHVVPCETGCTSRQANVSTNSELSDSIQILVSPNPTNNLTTMAVHSNKPGTYHLLITDLMGNEVYNGTFNTSDGQFYKNFNFVNRPGVYYFKIWNNQSDSQTKLLVIR